MKNDVLGCKARCGGKSGQGSNSKDGVNGKSAYELWIEAGNAGSFDDFLASLKGDKGDDGKSAYAIWLEQGNIGTEQDFLDSLKGQDGTGGLVSGSLTPEQLKNQLEEVEITDFIAEDGAEVSAEAMKMPFGFGINNKPTQLVNLVRIKGTDYYMFQLEENTPVENPITTSFKYITNSNTDIRE